MAALWGTRAARRPGGRAGAARRPAPGPGEPHAAPRRIGTGPGRSGVAGQPPAPTPGTVSFRQPAVIKTNVIPNRKTLFGKKGPRFFLYRNSSNPCSHNRNYSTPNVPRLGSALKVTNTFSTAGLSRAQTGPCAPLRPPESPGGQTLPSLFAGAFTERSGIWCHFIRPRGTDHMRGRRSQTGRATKALCCCARSSAPRLGYRCILSPPCDVERVVMQLLRKYYQITFTDQ